MADIAIFVSNINNSVDGTKILLSGDARLSTMVYNDPSVHWEVELSWNATTAVMNRDIQLAAIAAAEANGFTVSANDNKKLFAGAGGL
jgi:hypothetical protein